MIGYISGKLQASTGKYLIIDVHGVGYRVVVPEKIHASLATVGSDVTLYTHFVMNPRDGAVELFGFATPEELHFFELLTSISGVGPKSAQAILTKAELQPLQLAILQGDETYLRTVAGLGPKTAQRLILELKEKIASVPVGDGLVQASLTSESEAIQALMSLGYSQYQARDALKAIDGKLARPEDKITAALKMLAKK